MDIDLKQQFDDDPIGKLTGLNDAAMLEGEKLNGREVDEEYEQPLNQRDKFVRDRVIHGSHGPSRLSLCPDVMNASSARSALSYLL